MGIHIGDNAKIEAGQIVGGDLIIGTLPRGWKVDARAAATQDGLNPAQREELERHLAGLESAMAEKPPDRHLLQDILEAIRALAPVALEAIVSLLPALRDLLR